MRISNKRCPVCGGINNIYEVASTDPATLPRAECTWCHWIGPQMNLISDPPETQEKQEKKDETQGEPQLHGKVIYVCNKCDVAFTKGVVNEKCPICGEPVELLTRIKIVRETPDGPNVRQAGQSDSVIKGLNNSAIELIIYTLLETPAVRATVAKTVVKVLGKFMKAGKMTL